MATGVSKTKWTGGQLDHAPRIASSEISLSYEGKEPVQKILATPPAMTTALWSEQPSGKFDAGNHLYFGENLGILASLLQDTHVKGHVKLVYIGSSPRMSVNWSDW